MYKNRYAQRDIESSDELMTLYSHHVNSMTGEKLHSKADIAAELAYRDFKIKELSNYINELWRIRSFDVSKIFNFQDYSKLKSKTWTAARKLAKEAE